MWHSTWSLSKGGPNNSVLHGQRCLKEASNAYLKASFVSLLKVRCNNANLGIFLTRAILRTGEYRSPNSENTGQIIIASVRTEHGKCLLFVTGLSLQACIDLELDGDPRCNISYPSMNLTELSIGRMYLRKLQSRRFLLVAPPLKGHSGAKITTHVFLSFLFLVKPISWLIYRKQVDSHSLPPPLRPPPPTLLGLKRILRTLAM